MEHLMSYVSPLVQVGTCDSAQLMLSLGQCSRLFTECVLLFSAKPLSLHLGPVDGNCCLNVVYFYLFSTICSLN